MTSSTEKTAPGTGRPPSSLQRVAAFVAGVGEGGVFTKLQLFQAVPGISQADRRMRDLRPIGWAIDNYKVNPRLKPDEYLVRVIGVRIDQGEAMPATVRKGFSGPKRRRIIARDGSTCQVCRTPMGEAFWDQPGTLARPTIGHIVPVSRGGSNADSNLQLECQRCNDEARDVTVDPPTKEQVLTEAVHVGGLKEKQRLYGWMVAGRRPLEDIDEVFLHWRRLPDFQKLEVRDALASQIIAKQA